MSCLCSCKSNQAVVEPPPPPSSPAESPRAVVVPRSIPYYDTIQKDALQSSQGGSVYFDAMESMEDIDDENGLQRRRSSRRGGLKRGGSSSRHRLSSRFGNLLTRSRKLRAGITTQKGFPGNLTEQQLGAMRNFRKKLQDPKLDPSFREMVYVFEGLEEEEFALCRFLRSRNFNEKDTLKMIEDAVPHWTEARNNDFYPDINSALGAPAPVFLSQYPFFYYGNAKDGYPVGYFSLEDLNADGIECITSLDGLAKYLWHIILFSFKQKLSLAKASNPDFLRCEGITLVNLSGLTRSQINSKTLGVVKKLSDISACFPEMLHKMVIINAPSFFSISWKIIKRFVDPDTAKKIEIYSDAGKGTKRLLELIDENQLPSDFGGKADATRVVRALVDGESRDSSSSSSRQVVDLLSIKGRGQAAMDFQLAKDESLSLTVYTRAVSDAEISLFREGILIKKTEISEKKNTDVESAVPFNRDVVTDFKSPGKFHVSIKKEIDDGNKDHYLVFGKISKFAANDYLGATIAL